MRVNDKFYTAGMRIFIQLLAAALLPVMANLPARAADPFPSKPVRLIVPFATGGLSDIVARMLALKLTEAFRQSVIVDNRPGGSGVPGTELAIRATPDGHTLVMVSEIGRAHV